MKDILLILVLLAVAALGYFIMTKVDLFIEENRRLTLTENRHNSPHIHIAAESPMLLDSIAAQLEAYSNADPFVEIFLSTGKTDRILQKLMDGTLDILLLTEVKKVPLDELCAIIQIPYRTKGIMSSSLGLSFENLDNDDYIFVVWNKLVKSKARDRVLFAIESEYRLPKSDAKKFY